MSAAADSTLYIHDLPRIVVKYRRIIFLVTLLGMALGMAAAQVVPKKYKAHFVLTIYSKYFQSPLVGDFVPELSESSEGKVQRESLIRQVLTPDYLDMLGTKFHIYKEPGTGVSPDSMSERSEERQELRSRIDIDSLNTTTFAVSFVYSNPSIALDVTQDVYTHVIQNLLDTRAHILANVRDAIQNHVASLATTMNKPPEQKLAVVRAQIRALSALYTDQHPLMIQLHELEKSLENHGDSAVTSSPTGTTAKGADSEREIYDDLTKKLGYLNIAIDSDQQHESDYFATLESPQYPASSLGPRKFLVVLWGMTLGFFGAFFIAAIREYFDRSTLSADALAHQIQMPLLGELPAFSSKMTR